ncbi:hypothetical protein D9M69_684610 [compost metagenome]
MRAPAAYRNCASAGSVIANRTKCIRHDSAVRDLQRPVTRLAHAQETVGIPLGSVAIHRHFAGAVECDANIAVRCTCHAAAIGDLQRAVAFSAHG